MNDGQWTMNKEEDNALFIVYRLTFTVWRTGFVTVTAM